MPEIPEQEAGKAGLPADREAGLAMPIGRSQGDTDESVSASMNEAGETIRQEAGSWADEARHQGRRMFNEQKGQMAEQITGIAQALRQSADQSQQQDDREMAGRVLRQAASGLDQLSEVLRKGDADALLQRTSRLMREQPALFMGGAVAAGFVLSRFLKSSSDRAYGSGGSSADRWRADSDRVSAGGRTDSDSTASSNWGE